MSISNNSPQLLKNRIYNPIEEAKDTKLESRLDILNASDERNWAKGDLFRILILHKYGGVYVDFDVVFLRVFQSTTETRVYV